MDNDTYDDRTNIKFLKQNEVNELQVTINRNIVERIEELEDKFDEHKHDIEVQFERIEDILVVHRNQDRSQKKNYKALRDVWDKTVLKIIEKGEHGKEQ